MTKVPTENERKENQNTQRRNFWVKWSTSECTFFDLLIIMRSLQRHAAKWKDELSEESLQKYERKSSLKTEWMKKPARKVEKGKNKRKKKKYSLVIT